MALHPSTSDGCFARKTAKTDNLAASQLISSSLTVGFFLYLARSFQWHYHCGDVMLASRNGTASNGKTYEDRAAVVDVTGNDGYILSFFGFWG